MNLFQIVLECSFNSDLNVCNRMKSSCLFVGTFITAAMFHASASDLPNFEELTLIRAKAHQDRSTGYVLKKLEVYSLVQNQRGMCLDFVGESDGLYRSIFDGGPLMVDVANCSEEGDWIDGRIRALKVLGAREHREGLSVEQIDQVISEINALFRDQVFDLNIIE